MSYGPAGFAATAINIANAAARRFSGMDDQIDQFRGPMSRLVSGIAMVVVVFLYYVVALGI